MFKTLDEIDKDGVENPTVDYSNVISKPDNENEWIDMVRAGNIPQGFGINSEHMDEHFRLKEKTMVGIFGLDNLGKALCVKTPIPIPGGFKPMGEIKVGDIVYDENGNECNVIYATGYQYGKKCYRVSFDNKTSVIACEDHLWSVKKHSSMLSTKTTKQLLKEGLRNNRNQFLHRIPVAKSLKNNKDITLPIDPYLLGLWIGDGNTDLKGGLHFNFGIQDSDFLINEITKLGFICTPKNYDEVCVKVNIRRKDSIKNANLIDSFREIFLGKGKFIPELYKKGSLRQKTELIQGLMDTDGCMNKNNIAEFCSIHESISDDVYEMLSSFGLKPYKYNKSPKISGVPVNNRAYTICCIYDRDFDINIFRLPRKYNLSKSLGKKSKTRQSWVSIVNIEEVESVPVKCIQVDSPNSLYVFGKNNLVTHNTSFYIFLTVCWARYHNLKFLLYTKENREASIRQKIMEFYLGHSLSLGSDERFLEAREFSYKHFDIINNKTNITKDNIFDVLEKQDLKKYFAIFLDPYNAIQYEQLPKSNYEFLDNLRHFQETHNISFHISMHISSDKARNFVYNQKDFIQTFEGEMISVDGQPKIPRKNFVEGGQPIANKLDDIIVVHRLIKVEELRSYTLISVDKVKETATGGMPTFELPIMFKMEKWGNTFIDKNYRNPLIQNKEQELDFKKEEKIPTVDPSDAFDFPEDDMPF